MSEPRLRRARALVAWWQEGEFLVENFLSGQRTAISPLVGQLLGEFESFRGRDEALRVVAEVPDGQDLLDLLLARGILVAEGSDLEQRDRQLDESWVWPLDARFFHFSSRPSEFQDQETQERNLERLAREEPPPSPYKRCGPSVLQLPGDFEEPRGELWSTLRERRTRRYCSPRPLALDVFSRLLLWTWGESRRIDDPAIGPYILKTSPSGGARHPVEVYPLVRRVEGVEPGVYHYSVEDHALERIGEAIADDRVVELCGGQPWLRDTPVIFLMTALLERSMWKYRQAHAYRVVHLDAGHLGQTFHLVATRLGLAPLTFGALATAEVEAILGLDGIREILLYAAAAGHPATEPVSA